MGRRRDQTAFISEFFDIPINLVFELAMKACLALRVCFPLGKEKSDSTGILEFFGSTQSWAVSFLYKWIKLLRLPT
jgi:hypothetical protein